MAPSGKSAMIVIPSLLERSLPAAAPPSFRKSSSFMAATFPAPTTIRREALRPSGAKISSVDPLFPLNWPVAATRPTRLAARPSALRVAAPNLRPSSQKITRMPRRAVENGTKPTLTASDIGKSSNGGIAVGNPGSGSRNALSGQDSRSSRVLPGTMTRRRQGSQASGSDWEVTYPELLT